MTDVEVIAEAQDYFDALDAHENKSGTMTVLHVFQYMLSKSNVEWEYVKKFKKSLP